MYPSVSIERCIASNRTKNPILAKISCTSHMFLFVSVCMCKCFLNILVNFRQYWALYNVHFEHLGCICTCTESQYIHICKIHNDF